MNEKSNPMPMMYKTIPAVAELNKVPGFDPLKFLRHKVSRKTNEEMLQLELPYQKLWFRLRHPQGRMKLTTMNICRKITEVVRWLHLMWWNWTAKANAHTSM